MHTCITTMRLLFLCFNKGSLNNFMWNMYLDHALVCYLHVEKKVKCFNVKKLPNTVRGMLGLISCTKKLSLALDGAEYSDIISSINVHVY